MADVTDLSGVISTLGIFVDQSATSTPDWQYMCAMNSRSFNLSRGEQSTPLVATCGPGASLETWRAAGALDWTIQGEGALELETFDFCRTWMLAGDQRTMRIVFYTGDKTNLTAHGYFQGDGVLLQYPVSQPDANGIPTATVNISKGASTLVWTTGAPPV